MFIPVFGAFGGCPKPIFDALAKKPGTPLWLQLALRSRLADSGAQLSTNLQALKGTLEGTLTLWRFRGIAFRGCEIALEFCFGQRLFLV